MAGLSPFAGQFAQFIPSCIGRGGAAVNPAQPQPAKLAIAGIDQGDGTGALLVQQTTSSAVKILDKGGVNQASVDANGAVLVEFTAVQTQVLGSAIGTAAAANSVSLPAAAGSTTFITGFEVTTGAVVAAVSGALSVVGPATTLNYIVSETVAGGEALLVTFPDPIAASAANTPIILGLAAITSGAGTAINVHGFQR